MLALTPEAGAPGVIGTGEVECDLAQAGEMVDSHFKRDTKVLGESLERRLVAEALARPGVEGPEQGVEVGAG